MSAKPETIQDQFLLNGMHAKKITLQNKSPCLSVNAALKNFDLSVNVRYSYSNVTVHIL
jgi:hypothetical protein